MMLQWARGLRCDSPPALSDGLLLGVAGEEGGELAVNTGLPTRVGEDAGDDGTKPAAGDGDAAKPDEGGLSSLTPITSMPPAGEGGGEGDVDAGGMVA